MHRILLTTGLFVALVTMACSKRLVCFYDRNAANRPFIGNFTPANINPLLCTHIICSYAVIDDNNSNKNKLIPVDQEDFKLYKQLNDLKKSNSELKTLLSVGDPKSTDTQTFTTMVASKATRQEFITSAIEVVQQHGFDGINLDWNYPSGQAERTKFTELCKELRTAFTIQSLLLTASVSGMKTIIDDGYEVSLIAPELDFINVLTYNFYSPTELATAHHSPLGPLSSNPSDTLTTEFAMTYWKTQGGAALPADKLNIGIAAFGIAFRLADPSVHGVGATTSTVPPEEGCYTAQPGFWSYYETCLYRQGVAEQWIQSQSVPYAVTEGQWVGYDNTDSLDAKVAHMKSKGYGGVFVWSVDLDDYTGQFCENGTNPFISYLKSIL